MEERDSEDRQRSASVLIDTSKTISGGAGTNRFILITTACPQVGILDAEKVFW